MWGFIIETVYILDTDRNFILVLELVFFINSAKGTKSPQENKFFF